MFYSIYDFAPLIQLLVGSVFLNEYFTAKKWFILSSEQKKTITENTPPALKTQYITRKMYKHSIDANQNLYRSVLSILSLYGCISLFYCATCHSHTSDIVIYDVSCFGPIMTTIIVIAYLIWALCVYGHIGQKWHQYVTIVVFILLVFSFLLFFLFFPLLFANTLEPARPYINISILFTLLIWFLHIAKKKILIKACIPYWMDVVRYLKLILPPDNNNIDNTISTILETIKNNPNMKRHTRYQLIKLCILYLHDSMLFCKDSNGERVINKTIIQSNIVNVTTLIDNSSIRNIEKRKLKKNIPNKLSFSIDLSNGNYKPTNISQKKQIKMGMKIVRRLAQFGAYENSEEEHNAHVANSR